MKNKEIDDLYLTYKEALKVLRDKFEKLQKSVPSEESPISYVKHRLKTKKSTKEKLEERLNLEYNAKNIEDYLYDIAEIRIVCPFLSDTNKIIEFINDDPDIEIVEVKNYIKDPKPSGYSSYHMKVLVHITINGKTKKVKAEIQIRTMAMDVIASIEHKIRYKKNSSLSQEQEDTFMGIVDYVYMLDSKIDNFIIKKRLENIPREEQLEFIIKNISFRNLLKKYELALAKIKGLLEGIKLEYEEQGLINPIEHIKDRIKPDNSIVKKLGEKGKSYTLENIEEYITDVGAIKVVCSFLSDVEILKEKINELERLNLLRIVETQDYIKTPKPCGYSSYHLVVEVPIDYNGKVEFIKIEIQIRTIIMDFWAKIEHILCYKKEETPEIRKELKGYATEIRKIEPQIDSLASNVFEKRGIKRILDLFNSHY